MKREKFISVFVGVMIQRLPLWLPEESTEEELLSITHQRMGEHAFDIKEVLGRSGGEERRISDRRQGDRRAGDV